MGRRRLPRDEFGCIIRDVQKMDDRFAQDDGNILTVADSMKKRQWFLCVNQKAECFNDIVNRVESYGDKGSGWYHYAMICHDKDTINKKKYDELMDLSLNNDDIFVDRLCGYRLIDDEFRSDKAYAYKPVHWHILICTENPRSWSSVKNWFKGAHVQSCISVENSFRYLTHETRDCAKCGKVKYNREDIIMSNRFLDWIAEKIKEDRELEYFDSHKIAKYCFIDGLEHYTDFDLRFGAPQVQRWMSSINSWCNMKREFMQLIGNNREICGDRKFCYYDSSGLHFVYDDEVIMHEKLNASFVKLFDIKDWYFNLHLTDFGKEYYKICFTFNVEISDIEKFLVFRNEPRLADSFGLGSYDLVIDSDIDADIVTDFGSLKVVGLEN